MSVAVSVVTTKCGTFFIKTKEFEFTILCHLEFEPSRQEVPFRFCLFVDTLVCSTTLIDKRLCVLIQPADYSLAYGMGLP